MTEAQGRGRMRFKRGQKQEVFIHVGQALLIGPSSTEQACMNGPMDGLAPIGLYQSPAPLVQEAHDHLFLRTRLSSRK